MTKTLQDRAIVERVPLMEGRNMTIILAPLTTRQQAKDQKADGKGPVGEAGTTA